MEQKKGQNRIKNIYQKKPNDTERKKKEIIENDKKNKLITMKLVEAITKQQKQ